MREGRGGRRGGETEQCHGRGRCMWRIWRRIRLHGNECKNERNTQSQGIFKIGWIAQCIMCSACIYIYTPHNVMHHLHHRHTRKKRRTQDSSVIIVHNTITAQEPRMKNKTHFLWRLSYPILTLCFSVTTARLSSAPDDMLSLLYPLECVSWVWVFLNSGFELWTTNFEFDKNLTILFNKIFVFRFPSF